MTHDEWTEYEVKAHNAEQQVMQYVRRIHPGAKTLMDVPPNDLRALIVRLWFDYDIALEQIEERDDLIRSLNKELNGLTGAFRLEYDEGEGAWYDHAWDGID